MATTPNKQRKRLDPPSIKLNESARAEASALLALIQQKQLELKAAQDALVLSLMRHTGVDLIREEWELDIDHALLERKESPSGQ